MKEFKAESKRLLDLMINSIYTHKEIFLRELISNASDAIDKLHFMSLTDSTIKSKLSDYRILIETDKKERMLKISDNGIGMTADEMENNLGTIAKSGSFDFKEQNKDSKDTDIIGQFGVGFYSAFMIAKSVTVISRKVGETVAHKWVSSGADGYELSETGKAEPGTDVMILLKENDKDENYDKYLSEYELRTLVRKYSDYIRYPIRMQVTKSRKKEGSEEYEDYTEIETLNSMMPIWKKAKKDVKKEEYNRFYLDKFNDYAEPLKVIHVAAEGLTTYNALLFVPSKPPINFYTKDYEKGLQLYASGVMIMNKCADLLPDCFGFVRGIVDSPDLSLNISREMLQHDRQLKVIASGIEKKIKNELLGMQKKDRESYEKMYAAFGRSIKMGALANFGAKKELVLDLIMAYSSIDEKLTTFDEYVSRMKDGQDVIYYACGEDASRLKKLPKTEQVVSKGFEVLLFTDEFDEMMLKMIENYKDKKFCSVSDSNLDLATEEEKKQTEEKSKELKDVIDCITESLKGQVEKVVLSDKLLHHAVALSSEGEISIEMEKFLSQMPEGKGVKAKRVLEINSNHTICDKLTELFHADKEKLKTYAKILYNAALLIEGIMPDDAVEFTDSLTGLMV